MSLKKQYRLKKELEVSEVYKDVYIIGVEWGKVVQKTKVVQH